MLPKKHRTTIPHFYALASKVFQYSSPFVLLRIKKTENKTPQFVFTVPKSLDKRSSQRNRTKRILSSILFSEMPHIKGECAVVVKAQKILGENTSDPIHMQLVELLEKAGLYSK